MSSGTRRIGKVPELQHEPGTCRSTESGGPAETLMQYDDTKEIHTHQMHTCSCPQVINKGLTTLRKCGFWCLFILFHEVSLPPRPLSDEDRLIRLSSTILRNI